MYLWICLTFVCLSHNILASYPVNETTIVQPPDDNFCFFTTGQYIFADRMKSKVSSAKFQGVGTPEDIYGHRYYEPIYKLQRLYGAVYYVPNSDKAKLVNLARKGMFLSDLVVKVTFKKRGKPRQSISCVTIDFAPETFALPFAIYARFPRDISRGSYFNRLLRIGAPQSYINWLRQFQFGAYFRAPYYQPRYFVPPPPKPPGPSFGPGPVIQPYPIPSDKVCVFVCSSLIYKDRMTSIIPTATLISSAYLSDKDIALGGRTAPGKVQEYQGFDRIWGAAYEICKSDLPRLVRALKPSLFYATNLSTIVKGLYEAKCISLDLGLIPAGFPFRVFESSRINARTYLKGLENLDVPQGYVQALRNLPYQK